MAQNGKVLLVGSVGLEDADQVFRALGERLGSRAKRYPDGETGPRYYWIRWVAELFQGVMTTALEDDELLREIRIPLLILAAAREQIVSTPAIEQLGLRLRTGRHMVIAGSRHEMFMEADPVRGQVFAAFDAFITEQSR